MIVELRKVKITKSIFNQLLKPIFQDLKKQDYQVLGWVFEKTRFILLYFPETNSLKKMPFISDLNIDERRPRTVSFKMQGFISLVDLSSYTEAKDWIAMINELQSTAKIKGQIFI